MRFKVWLLLITLSPGALLAQVVIRGTVTSAADKEGLAFANVFLLPDSIVAICESDGDYSIRTASGPKQIRISFTGYRTQSIAFKLSQDTTIDIRMEAEVRELSTITIDGYADRQEQLLNSSRSGTNVLTQKDITSVPSLMGEADVIKTLQLLPGTIKGVEGSSDLFVRGGAADQNLVLLDKAPIYNTSHLFGFLSVFNPDILDHVESINGAFPAQYGGRLSSILNVNTISEIADRTHLSADIGLISSRLFVDQPLIKDKAGIWLAGRRTYIDQVVRAIGDELPYYFYDINGKLILKPTLRDRIEFSHYNGDDILDIFRDRNNDGNGFLTTYSSGNSSQSLNWSRQLMSRWKMESAVMRSSFQYSIRNIFEENSLVAFSDIEDIGAEVMLSRDSVTNASFKTGISWMRHDISPNVINSQGTIAELLESSASSGRIANEFALFSQYEKPVNNKLMVSAGVRLSAAFVKNRNYFTPEPRIGFKYSLGENHVVKLSYSRMAQYLHRISNSALSTPTDIWYPVTREIAPQTSHQTSVAWQRIVSPQRIFLSVEGYYKWMDNLVGYEEGTNLFFNTDFASRLIQGSGKAYGFEFLVRKNAGKFTGWISYTLSWAWRRYDEVNNGDWFHARYDRRHNGAMVGQYTIAKRWAVSLVFEYISGARFTPVIGQYAMVAPTLTGMDLIPVFAEINGVKLADTHRLDAGLKFRSKPGKKFQWQWFGGVYNAYNRANPIGITIEQNGTDGSLKYSQPGLFGLLPFISYGFKI